MPHFFPFLPVRPRKVCLSTALHLACLALRVDGEVVGFHIVTVLHQGRFHEIECRYGTVDATFALEAEVCMLEPLTHSFVDALINGRSGTFHPGVDRLPRMERVFNLCTVLPPPCICSVHLPLRKGASSQLQFAQLVP